MQGYKVIRHNHKFSLTNDVLINTLNLSTAEKLVNGLVNEQTFIRHNLQAAKKHNIDTNRVLNDYYSIVSANI